MENKSKKVTNVPNLRFIKSSYFLTFKLSELTEKISSGKDKIAEISEGKYPMYGSTGSIGFSTNYSYTGPKILVARVGANAGFCYIVNGKYSVTDNTLIISPHNLEILKYLFYLITSKHLNKLSFGSGQPLITGSQLASLIVSIPKESKEISKVANLMSLLDKRISTQNKIIKDIISLKKGIKSRIFSSQKANHTIGDFLVEYAEKNQENFEPVSVGKYGIRKRSDLFSRELSKNYSKNKVIHKNSLIIGMGTKEIDVAVLLEDKNYCVSPAYTTYKIQNINSYYFNELLDNFNHLLSLRYMITGARQGKSVNKKDLLKHSIYIHSQDCQNKIVNLLKSLDHKIRIESNLLKQYNLQKQYLLNNLFI